MSRSDNYGSKYWGITFEGETFYLSADRLEVLPCGALVAWGGYRKDGAESTDDAVAVYCAASWHWDTFFAASALTGDMVAAD